jgi:hypothetical protein
MTVAMQGYVKPGKTPGGTTAPVKMAALCRDVVAALASWMASLKGPGRSTEYLLLTRTNLAHRAGPPRGGNGVDALHRAVDARPTNMSFYRSCVAKNFGKRKGWFGDKSS